MIPSRSQRAQRVIKVLQQKGYAPREAPQGFQSHYFQQPKAPPPTPAARPYPKLKTPPTPAKTPHTMQELRAMAARHAELVRVRTLAAMSSTQRAAVAKQEAVNRSLARITLDYQSQLRGMQKHRIGWDATFLSSAHPDGGFRVAMIHGEKATLMLNVDFAGVLRDGQGRQMSPAEAVGIARFGEGPPLRR